MTTGQMECFLQAASLLNFTAAAERLYMTQPALSHQISNIENELNVKLFVRGNNAVRLTPAGQVLYKGLQGVLSDYKQLIVQVENVSLGITGEFNIGLMEDLLLDDNIAKALKQLKTKKPGLNINIHKKDMAGIFAGLADGSLDVAIALLSFVQSGRIQIKELNHEPLYMAISKSGSADLPDKIDYQTFIGLLDEFPLTLIAKKDTAVPIRDAASGPLRELNRRGCHPFVNLISSVEELGAQIAAGLGIIIANRSHIISTEPNVRMIELDFDESERDIWPNFQRGVLYRSLAENSSAETFLEILEGII